MTGTFLALQSYCPHWLLSTEPYGIVSLGSRTIHTWHPSIHSRRKTSVWLGCLPVTTDWYVSSFAVVSCPLIVINRTLQNGVPWELHCSCMTSFNTPRKEGSEDTWCLSFLSVRLVPIPMLCPTSCCHCAIWSLGSRWMVGSCLFIYITGSWHNLSRWQEGRLWLFAWSWVSWGSRAIETRAGMVACRLGVEEVLHWYLKEKDILVVSLYLLAMLIFQCLL